MDSIRGGIRRVRADQQKRAGNDPKSVIARDRESRDDEYRQLVNSRPGFESARGPDGALKADFRSAPQYSQLSALEARMGQAKDVSARDVKTGQDFANAQQDMGKLRERAFGTGPSAWAQARGRLADADTQAARGQLQNSSAAAAASARSQMASRGGMDAGAAGRLSSQALKERIRGNVALNQGNVRNKMQISADDEAQRMQLQQQLPGMGTQMDAYNTGIQGQNANRDLQSQQYNSDMAMKKAGMWGTMADGEAARNQQNNQFNAGNALQDLGQQNQHNQNAWQTQMGVYGANRTADAQAAAARGSKPGLLGQVFGGLF